MRYCCGGLVLLFGLCILSVGCAREETAPLAQMEFRVDSTLLGAVIEVPNHDLRFNPPVGWASISDSGVVQVNEEAPGEEGAITVEAAHLFFHPTHRSVLSVSVLRQVAGGRFEERIAAYAEVLKDAFPGPELKQTAFRKDGLHIVQFLARPEGLVNFKIVLDTPSADLIQFDYVVPQPFYEEQVRAIESSIGSIQPLD